MAGMQQDFGNETPPWGYQQQLRETVGVREDLLQNNTLLALWTPNSEVKTHFNLDCGEGLKQGKHSPTT